jgi:hypothetical protein
MYQRAGGKERYRILIGKTGGHYFEDLFVYEVIILKMEYIK